MILGKLAFVAGLMRKSPLIESGGGGGGGAQASATARTADKDE